MKMSDCHVWKAAFLLWILSDQAGKTTDWDMLSIPFNVGQSDLDH